MVTEIEMHGFSSSEPWWTETTSWPADCVRSVRILHPSTACLSGNKSANGASSLLVPVLIYEPANPEASEFLPLLRQRLLEGEIPAPHHHLKHTPFLIHTARPKTHEFVQCFSPYLEQQAEHSTKEEEDDDSGSDEETSGSSSCSSSSCSSPSPSGDDVDKEKRVNTHKPCPPSHVCP